MQLNLVKILKKLIDEKRILWGVEMSNYMEQVAEILGVELNEEFKVFHTYWSTVKLTEEGLSFVNHLGCLKNDAPSICLMEILNGNYKIERIKL